MNLLAWHIAILPFEKLVHRAPRYFGVRLRTFSFLWAANRVRGSRENGTREEQLEKTGSLECQLFGAGASWSLAAIFTSSAREPAFIFRITLPR